MAKYLDIDKFIEAIRVRPPLWNRRDPMHRNPQLTRYLWDAIREEMGGDITVAELKHKWHNLRDCFRREERTTKVGKKKRTWAHYNQMLFLLMPYGDLRDVLTDYTEKDTMLDLPIKKETPDEALELDLNNEISDYCEIIKNENFGDETMIEEDNTQTEEECRLSGKPSQNEISDNTMIPTLDEMNEHEKYCRGQIENEEDGETEISARAGEFSTRPTNILDNDDYHFAMSIIPQMRHVPIHRKLRMKIRISEIISQEAGFDEITS